MDPFPPDAFLSTYPDAIHATADQLRAIVRRAVPDAVERVRIGWRLIGYDVPVGRRQAFFAYVAPEPVHVHLGFQHGIHLPDPDALLEGAHLSLRQVRYVTFEPGAVLDEPRLIEFTRQAARIAAMTRAERLSLALDRDAAPPGA